MSNQQPAEPVARRVGSDTVAPLSWLSRVYYERTALAALICLIYAWYALSRWRQHQVAGFDLGIFDQAVRNYGHFRAPISSIKAPNANVLGDHFHPIIAVFGPLYWLWDDARVLLIAQTGLVAISVWVVHRYAARHLSRRGAGLAAIAYALGWPLQNLVDFDFHEVAFAVPLLACAIDALDRRSDRTLLLSAFLLLLVREDMGLVVACLGIIRAWRRPHWPGALLIVAGPTVFFIVLHYVIPFFGFGFTYWTYTALGPDLPSAVVFIISHPLDTLALLVTPPIKSFKLIMLFAPVAFLALRSPYLLPVAPLLAGSLLSNRTDLWGVDYHHSSALWPIVFLAAVDGAARLRLPNRQWSWRAVQLLMIGFPLVGMLSSSSTYPVHRLFDGGAFVISSHMRDRTDMVKAIPPSTCVEADNKITVLLTRTNLVSMGGTLGRPPDFYAIDLRSSAMNGVPPGEIRRLALNAGYTTVHQSGSLVLLQRPGYRGPASECAPN